MHTHENVRVHVVGIYCSDKSSRVNFMGHVAGTKSPPNWCCTIDHFTVVAKLPGIRMEARLPVTLF